MAEYGTSSSSSTCYCGAVCRCGLRDLRSFHSLAGEGELSFRPSTVISWQHFPPSTSSRSRCDESSTESPKVSSLIESSSLALLKAEEESAAASLTEYPITKSIAQMDAEHYLRIRHVRELFNFLIGHLICAEPDDPVQYLTEILDRCLNFRDCYGEEPLLVTKFHLKSLYDAFDPFEKKHITVDQYEVAMDNIGLSRGITRPNPCPPLDDEGKVSEEYFLAEAHRCLRTNLQKMLRVPKDWEENRLYWRKRMLRRRKTPCKPGTRDGNVEPEDRGERSSTEPSECRCSGFARRVVCPGTCPCPPEMRHEPEQLFLTG